MGTATEQSLRNILKELESDTLPTDAATETTLALILAECEDIPKHANLDIHPTTKHLGVAVDETVNPSNLDIAISTLRDAIIGVLPNLASLGDIYAWLSGIEDEIFDKLETGDLNLDATKDLQVDVKTMPTTTVQAAGGDKIFSFESIVEQEVSSTNLATGVNDLNGTAVGSGKVWKITHACCNYVGTLPSRMRIRVQGLASAIDLLDSVPTASSVFLIWSGEVYLQAGDYMQCAIVGATAGDDAYFRYAGVQMDAPS